MRVSERGLARQLDAAAPTIILIHGNQPLLIEETLDQLRAALRERGFDERRRMTVETGFNWDELLPATQSLSLFSSKRLIELRMPKGRPGDKGSKAIIELGQADDPDTLLVIISGRLDKRQLSSKWVQAVDRAGWVIDLPDVQAADFGAWLKQRLQSRGLRVERGVVDMLAFYLEGNLLAAAQEIDKLKVLATDGAVTLDMVRRSLRDQARFSIYTLVDVCLAGDAAKASRILTSLRNEGVEPVLVVWALAREIRAMCRIAGGIAAGRPSAQVFRENQVWRRREALVNSALQRFAAPDWYTMMERVAVLDQMVKGQRMNQVRTSVWHEIEHLALNLAGTRLAVQTEYDQRYVAS